MTTVIALFRGINVGGHHKVSMKELKDLFTSLDLRDAKTFIQSGNVVFKTKGGATAALARRIEAAFEQRFGFHSHVILRTAEELREVLARNPFAKRADVASNKLLITFISDDPGDEARQLVRAVPASPEEVFIDGRELFIYFPNGMGRTKLPVEKIGKLLKVPGTARNLNTVQKLEEMAKG